DDALEGFEDDARQLVAMLAHDGSRSLYVVERGHQDFLADAARDSRGIRDRLRKVTWPLGGKAHQRIVAHAVIAALEFEDLVALAEGTGGAHRIKVRLGAGGDETHLLCARHRVDDGLG